MLNSHTYAIDLNSLYVSLENPLHKGYTVTFCSATDFKMHLYH